MTSWRAQAACRDLPVDMFPTTQHGLDLAVAVCAGCPVIIDCHTAGSDETYGVWGGEPRGAGHDRCVCGRWVIRRRHASALKRCPGCQAEVRRELYRAKARRRRQAR